MLCANAVRLVVDRRGHGRERTARKHDARREEFTVFGLLSRVARGVHYQFQGGLRRRLATDGAFMRTDDAREGKSEIANGRRSADRCRLALIRGGRDVGATFSSVSERTDAREGLRVARLPKASKDCRGLRTRMATSNRELNGAPTRSSGTTHQTTAGKEHATSPSVGWV